VARVKGTLPYMEAGKVYTLNGASWKSEYYNQLKLFPNGKYKDMVDVTTMAINQDEIQQESFIDFTEIG
jgi:predicted phage terminase large subunit-like protein